MFTAFKDLYQRKPYDIWEVERTPVDDPTDWEGMPPEALKTSVNYLASLDSWPNQLRNLVWLILTCGLLALIFGSLLFVIGPLVGNDRFLWPLSFIGCLLGAGCIFYGPQKLHLVLLFPIAVLATWSLCSLTAQPHALVALSAAVSLLIADQMAVHYAFVRVAPPAPFELQERVKNNRNRRFVSPLYLLQLLATVLTLLLGMTLFTLLLERTSLAMFARPLSLCLVAILLVAIPFLFSSLMDSSPNPWHMAVATWKAFVSFATYGDTHIGPGMFRSPAGLVRTRLLSTTVAVIFVGAVHIPQANFFPLTEPPLVPFDINMPLSIKPPYDPTIPLSAEEQELLALTYEKLRKQGVIDTRPFLIAALRRWGHENAEEILPPHYATPVYSGNWIWDTLWMSTQRPQRLGYVLASLGICVLFPGAFFLICCFSLTANYNGWIYGETISYFGPYEGSDPTPDPYVLERPKEEQGKIDAETLRTARARQAIVDRIRFADDPVTRNHFYLGKNANTEQLILLCIDILRRHGHILGGSGSGKSALFLASLCLELLLRGDCNLVFLDCKADPSDPVLFEVARLAATTPQKRSHFRPNELSTLTHKFYNVYPDRQSHLCNPLLDSPNTRLTPNQRAGNLADSLGLTYGQDYGEGYFSSVNAFLGQAIFHVLVENYELWRPINFKMLHDTGEQLMTSDSIDEHIRKEFQKASHLLMMLSNFASIPTLNHIPSQTDVELANAAINFDDLFDSPIPQVYFFQLPGIFDSQTAGALARFFVHRILLSAQFNKTQNKRQTFVVIDEFQVAAAPNFVRLLELGRSYGVGFILANQTFESIREAGGEALVSALYANTRFRQIFDFSDPRDIASIAGYFGEYLARDTTVHLTKDEQVTGYTRSNRVVPRFSATELARMSANQHQSLVLISENRGYSRYNGLPVLTTSDFALDTKTWRRLKNAEPPGASPQTTTAAEFNPHSDDDLSGPAATSSPTGPKPQLPPQLKFQLRDTDDD